MITPRLMAFVLCSLLISNASAAKPGSAKKQRSPARSWRTVVDHAWKSGSDWPIKSPSSKTLGFTQDEVKAKGVSIDDDKATDGIEHAFKVVYENDAKGKAQPKEVSISTTKVVESGGKKEVDGYIARVSLEGKLIRGMRAAGPVGDVKQTPLDAAAADLKTFFEKEKKFYLREVDLASLTP